MFHMGAIDPGRIEVIDEMVARILRSKTVTQRVAMILQANQTMRQLIESPLRAVYPAYTDDQIRREVAGRMSRGSG